MGQKPTPRQTLILWMLIAKEGAAFQGEIGRKVEPRDRAALSKAGLLIVERRGRKLWLEATDKGWAWAADNLTAQLPAKAQVGHVLRAWLSRLQSYMKAKNVTLAEFVSPSGNGAAAMDESPVPLRERIRTTYKMLAGGAFNRRVLLRDLRVELANVDRATLDGTLLNMLRGEETSLIELDNRREITEADRVAAIYIGGEPRHILWIRR